MAHCQTCTCDHIAAAAAPQKSVRQLVGNVTWSMTAQGVRGPLCSHLKCGATLQYQTKKGATRPLRKGDVVGHNAGRLVCPGCGDDYLLGPEPRLVSDVKAEAEAVHQSHVAKGVL